MRSRKFFATAATAALLVVMGVVPAAAVDGTTTVTLSSVDTLTIIPTAASTLSTTGTTASGTIGITTVVDPAGAATTVSMSSSAFNQLPAGGTIAAANVSGCISGAPSQTVGTGATFSGTVTCASPVALDTAQTMFSISPSGTFTEFTFTPQVEVDVTSAPAGIYEGTITQTVV